LLSATSEVSASEVTSVCQLMSPFWSAADAVAASLMIGMKTLSGPTATAW
jgi:hypothetical protein